MLFSAYLRAAWLGKDIGGVAPRSHGVEPYPPRRLPLLSPDEKRGGQARERVLRRIYGSRRSEKTIGTSTRLRIGLPSRCAGIKVQRLTAPRAASSNVR
jgi:hypothetical protein